MKQQQTARETLAEAHKHMTPEQIAAHALGLAEVIEAYRRVLDGRELAMEHAGQAMQVHVHTINALLTEVRAAVKLAAGRRKVEARRRLQDIAERSLLPDLAVVGPETYRLMPLPPGLFSPAIEEPSDAE